MNKYDKKMMHDRELMYDAKGQLHKADKKYKKGDKGAKETMIHDRELIYDAGTQLHRTDKEKKSGSPLSMKSGGTFMSKCASPLKMSADLEYMPVDDKASAKMYGSKKPAMYGKGGPKLAPLAVMAIKAAIPALISRMGQKKERD